MITLAWARLFRNERADTAAIFTDRRHTARVLIPAPAPTPCAGPDCDEDTGSEFVHWHSDKCLIDWSLRRLQPAANTTTDTAAGGQP